VLDTETTVLRRNTIWPKQDFVVIPLELSTGPILLSAFGDGIPSRIVHVQFERNGVLEFAADDNFDPESLLLGPSFEKGFFNTLVEQGLLGEPRRS